MGVALSEVSSAKRQWLLFTCSNVSQYPLLPWNTAKCCRMDLIGQHHEWSPICSSCHDCSIWSTEPIFYPLYHVVICFCDGKIKTARIEYRFRKLSLYTFAEYSRSRWQQFQSKPNWSLFCDGVTFCCGEHYRSRSRCGMYDVAERSYYTLRCIQWRLWWCCTLRLVQSCNSMCIRNNLSRLGAMWYLM